MDQLTSRAMLTVLCCLTACVSGLRVQAPRGDASALQHLPSFALVEDRASGSAEQFMVAGQVSASEVEGELRQKITALLLERGYRQVPLSEAAVAVSIDANYYAKAHNMELEGTRSFLGTGNRQKGATTQQRELSVALDFVDLQGKSLVWRLTAHSPPPTAAQQGELTAQLMSLLLEIPRPLSPSR